MIQKVTTSLSLLLIVVFMASCDTPNQKEKSAIKSVEVKSAIKSVEVKPVNLAATESFDIMSTKLPKHFKAHNAVLLNLAKKIYSAKISRKDNFETTEDYNLRVKGVGPIQKVLGIDEPEKYYLTYRESLRLPFDYFDDQLANLEYDADIKKLKIIGGFAGNGIVFGVDEIERSIDMSHNKYGEEIALSKASGSSVKLNFVSDPNGLMDVKTDKVSRFIDYTMKYVSEIRFSFLKEIPMDIAQAKQITKKSLTLLIIFTLQEPWVNYYHYRMPPSFGVDENTDHYTLLVKAEQVWLYDFSTGDILEKWGIEKLN